MRPLAALLPAALALAWVACGGEAAATPTLGEARPAPPLTASPPPATPSPRVAASSSPEVTPTPSPVVTGSPTPAASPVPHEPVLTVSRRVVPQGGIVVAQVAGREVVAATARWLGRDYPLYPEGDALWAVLPVAPDQEPGDHPLEVRLVGAGEAPLEALAVAVTVVSGEFPVRDVELSPATSALFTPENVAEERAKAGAAYGARTPQRLWRGTFLLPVQAPVSSEYGLGTSYNGGPVASRHKGLDFGVPEGTPVRAANQGRVVLAEALPLSGNAVIINHGLGVFTLYSHLSAILVTAGQGVTRGELIGRTGQTGVAAGAHLHWAVVVAGVSVSPWTWVRSAVAPWEEALPSAPAPRGP